MCTRDVHFVLLFSILILATIINDVECVVLEVSCVIFSLDISLIEMATGLYCRQRSAASTTIILTTIVIEVH
jgi:hypothetical protein